VARRLARICVLALALVALAPAAAQAACTNTWLLGPATPGDWTNGANWSSGAAPTATDDVCIPAGSGTVTYSVPSQSVRSLQLARPLNLNSSTTLSVTGMGTNDSQLADGASIPGLGTLRFGASSLLEKVGTGNGCLGSTSTSTGRWTSTLGR
jgi:hypothetical protein